MRKPVRVNQHGLVVKPTRIDCVGEECPVAAYRGACFIDQHHLYFPARLRKITPLILEFALCPDNLMNMARCAHDRYHNKHRRARFPNEDVMVAFVGESNLRQDYFGLLKSIDVKMAAIEHEKIQKSSRLQVQDELLELWCRHQDMMKEAVTLEFLELKPEPIPELDDLLEKVA